MSRLLVESGRGFPFIVSGPSGVGKTTLVRRLHEEFDEVVQSISVTTRQPRDGEVDGQHYFFVSAEEFERRSEQGDFLEQVEWCGNRYGTSKSWVQEQLDAGKHVVLVIDTKGAEKVRKLWSIPSIFIRPPNTEALRVRLEARYTETSEAIDKRLHRAEQEMLAGKNYDFISRD